MIPHSASLGIERSIASGIAVWNAANVEQKLVMCDRQQKGWSYR